MKSEPNGSEFDHLTDGHEGLGTIIVPGPLPTPPAPVESASRHRHESITLSCTVVNVLCTIAIAVFSYLQWWATDKQWDAMKDQLVEMRADRKIASEGVAATKESNQITKQVAESGAAETKHSLAIGERSLVLSKAALEATVANARNDQRAWLGVSHFSPPKYLVEGKMVYLKVNEKSAFEAVIHNFGRSPATNLKAIVSFKSILRSTKFEAKYEDDPPVEQSQSVLFPTGTETVESKLLVASRSEQVEAIRSGATKGYFYGQIDYEDVFGINHRTTFCSYLAPDLASLTVCPFYNESN